jgi:signal transduction histidine kinase
LPHIFAVGATLVVAHPYLALTFCKRVMRAFEGDISVKSEVGKGTEFCLRF